MIDVIVHQNFAGDIPYQAITSIAEWLLCLVGNFKNLPYTVARRYQQKQFAELSSPESAAVKVMQKGNAVEFQGTKYEVGDFLVVGICPVHGLPEFGKLVKIANTDPVVLSCQKFVTFFNEHYHAYEIEHSSPVHQNINQCDLLYKQPVAAHSNPFTRDLLSVRHMIM